MERPELLRQAMVEGLSQAGVDCWIPRLLSYSRMDTFFVDLDVLFPHDTTLRLLAHPVKLFTETSPMLPRGRGHTRFLDGDKILAAMHLPPSVTLSELQPPEEWRRGIATAQDKHLRFQASGRYDTSGTALQSASAGRVVVAVGPEGGWTDEELHTFTTAAFTEVNLGERILKTEAAV